MTAGRPGPSPGLTLLTLGQGCRFRAADGGWGRGDRGVTMRRVQRGRRDADGAQEAGPGMQRGLQRLMVAGGRRRQEGSRSPGWGVRGTGRI